MIESLQPFAIAFFIGLLIGIERERSHPAGLQAIGVRTFVLLALLGTLAASIKEPVVSIVIAVFAFGAILLGYWRSSTTRNNQAAFGLTTEFTAGTVFCLGFITPHEPLLAAIIGAAVLLVLLGRERLHTFSRQQLKPQEIRAATTMLVILLGILPFLPNRTIDVWHLFNPQRFGILVLVIASIQFGGYVAMRVLGERLGMLLTGFFGGLVSSTAVFMNLPRMIRQRTELTRVATAAAILSTVAKLIQFIIILFIAAPQLVSGFIWPIAIMIIVGVGSAFLIAYKDSNKKFTPQQYTNPLDVKSVLRLAIFISAMIFIVGVIEFYAGTKGIQLVAFLGGLVGLHAITYALAILNSAGELPLTQTYFVLALALLANFLTKFVLLWALARNRFALYTSLILILMLVMGWVIYTYIV